MSAETDLPKLSGGRIDWERMVRAYARDFDMNFRDAMNWLSTRDSLEAAAQLLGAPFAPLPELGEFLDRRGYRVPKTAGSRIQDYVHMKVRKSKRQRVVLDATFKRDLSTEPKSVPVVRQATQEELAKYEEDKPVTIELTKEQYLEKRRAGMNRNEIAKECGYKNSGALYVHLSRWGLKDPSDEHDALRMLDKVDAQPALAETDKRVEPEYQCICGKPCDGPGVACSEECAAEVRGRLAPPVTDEATETSDKPSRPWLQKDVAITVTLTEAIVKHAVQALIEEAYDTAVEHGWHEQPVALPVQLALIHSEVSEALHADRKNEGPEAVAEELADVIIRVFDTAADHQLDVAGALFRKMEKNREREWRHGGRKY